MYKGILYSESIALKIIKISQNDSQRTMREVEAASKIKSDYIPKIMDFGTCNILNQPRWFIIEKFIDGQSFRAILQGTAKQPLARIISLLGQLLYACKDFEDHQLVHRDIKPENLLIDNSGKVWILDFGIARHLDLTSLTPNGSYAGIGTPGYGAPEQFRNLKLEINSRADLFAVGITIYEALSGSHPFSSLAQAPFDLVHKMEQTDIPKLSIPGDPTDDLSDFLSALTQRLPSRRPQNSGEAIAWYLDVKSKLQL